MLNPGCDSEVDRGIGEFHWYDPVLIRQLFPVEASRFVDIENKP
jgi:hypothetical protein